MTGIINACKCGRATNGKSTRCKICAKDHNAKYYQENKERLIKKKLDYNQTPEGKKKKKEYNQAYFRTESGKRVMAESKKKYIDNDPQKKRAISLVNSFLRYHGIALPSCVKCNEKAQGHHEDYLKPHEVVCFCPQHHSDRHTGKISGDISDLIVDIRDLQKCL